MWALALFALLSFQASAIDVHTNQQVLATQDELLMDATIPSPSFVGQAVTFTVRNSDGGAAPANEQYEWYNNGQLVSQAPNYTFIGGTVGPYNITVVLAVSNLVAFGKYSVTDTPLVISPSVNSPSTVGQEVVFYLKRAGIAFLPDERFEWHLDGTTVGNDNTNAFSMNSTLGTHNISCYLHVTQLYQSISYTVKEAQPVLSLKIQASIEDPGFLTVTAEFKPASPDISGTVSFWLKDGKLIQLNFTGSLVSFTKPLPLPMPTNNSWLHAHYDGNGIYAAADSNYMHIMANGSVLDDNFTPPLGSTGPTTTSPASGSTKEDSSSDSLSRTNIILIAIAASIAFFICCVCLFSRRNPHESTVIHDPLVN